MKLKEKIFSVITLTAATTGAISMINRFIFAKANSHVFPSQSPSSLPSVFSWRFGRIRYRKYGDNGKPLLLVHSIHPLSSSYEWDRLIPLLTKEHTVFVLDLIGCGFSEKPAFLYTNFLYVQLINDFITDVIGRRTDVLCSGNASSAILMACRNNDSLFDHITMINPESIGDSMKIPSSASRMLRYYYELPIIGTLGYNIAFSKRMVTEYLFKDMIGDHTSICQADIEQFYNTAHLGGANCKRLYASLCGNYVNINITNAVRDINHSITIIGGGKCSGISECIQEFKQTNSSIESFIIKDAKQLPAFECPELVAQYIF